MERGQAELLKHARPLAAGRWAGRLAERGLLRPQADAEAARPEDPRPEDRRDPLHDPLAVTEHCFIGDQIRLPATCCDIAGCGAEFADLAAMGEADNRTRALTAGWHADAFGQLVCPACQQRQNAARAQLPLPEPDTDGYPEPAAAPTQQEGRSLAAPPRPRDGSGPGLRAKIAGQLSTLSPSHHRPGQWLLALAALASGANGWRDPQPVTGSGRKRMS